MPDRVRIELLVESDVPIRGELTGSEGSGRAFEGWLELISAIQDSWRAAQDTPRQSPASPPDAA
jgi:hypothetical protein